MLSDFECRILMNFVLWKYVLYFESILLYFESAFLYFATLLASGCIENQYGKGKEKVVINVHFINANLLAVGNTTYTYFFKLTGVSNYQLEKWEDQRIKELKKHYLVYSWLMAQPWCWDSGDDMRFYAMFHRKRSGKDEWGWVGCSEPRLFFCPSTVEHFEHPKLW